MIRQQSNGRQQNQQFRQIDRWIINLNKLLGSGQMANVYEGWENQKPETKYAIKKQSFQQLTHFLGQQYTKFLSREVKIMKAIQNENIVKIIDVKMTPKPDFNFYIVMEYCEGNLAQKLDQMPHRQIKEEEAVKIFKQIMNGYSAINDVKAIHRDLKPENILFKDNVAKIADFGLSKIVENTEQLLQKVTVTGTPYYRAPQLLTTEKYADMESPQKIDIWSLGVLFYEMLVGLYPWIADSIAEYLLEIENNPVQFPKNLGISEVTQDLIFNMLIIDEKERFSYEDCMNHEFFKQEKEDQKQLEILKQQQVQKNSKCMDLEEFERQQKLNKQKLLQIQKEQGQMQQSYNQQLNEIKNKNINSQDCEINKDQQQIQIQNSQQKQTENIQDRQQNQEQQIQQQQQQQQIQQYQNNTDQIQIQQQQFKQIFQQNQSQFDKLFNCNGIQDIKSCQLKNNEITQNNNIQQQKQKQIPQQQKHEIISNNNTLQ